jgi:hypothetical protein
MFFLVIQNSGRQAKSRNPVILRIRITNLEKHFKITYVRFYPSQNNDFFVVARFDLQKTWRELVIAVVVPAVMFVVSSATLCIITRSVNVGDDTKMRCKYCVGSSDTNEDMALSRDATTNNTHECLLPRSEDNVRINIPLFRQLFGTGSSLVDK